MGGAFSGRRRVYSHLEDLPSIRTAMLRSHLLSQGQHASLNWGDRFRATAYTEGDRLCLKLNDGVPLTARISDFEMGFGGTRRFFHCPHCQRRCVVLYVLPQTLICRCCLGLLYHSQACSEISSQHLQMRRLSNRVNPAYRYSSFDLPPRPKLMRRKTYERLRREFFNRFIRLSQEIDRSLDNYDLT
jgi:hypothetical protein